MLRHLFTGKFLALYLLALSAPFWWLFRSWYGYRFLGLIILAGIVSIPCLLLTGFVLVLFEQEPTADLIISYVELYLPLAYYGALIQLPLAVLNILRFASSNTAKPNPGFAGNFLIAVIHFP